MASMTASPALSAPRLLRAVNLQNRASSINPRVSFSPLFSQLDTPRLSLHGQDLGLCSSTKLSPFVVRASEVLSQDASSSADAPPAKLFVGNLPFSMDSKSLADIFQEVGVVDIVEVVYDRESGRSRGFGFVTMNSLQDAENAINKLDGLDIGGRSIKVNFPLAKGSSERPRRDFERRSPPSRDSPYKLYIGNLSWGMDDESLQELFSEFGRVADAKVVTDRDTGRSRGFGFVTLSNKNEVDEAISALDGVEVDGRTIRVSLANVKKA